MYPLETAEHTQIRETVRRLAQKEVPKYTADEFYGTVPLDLFKTFAAAGLTGIYVPKEYGGIEADPLTAAIVIEEISKVNLGPAVFLSVHTMVSGLINSFGSSAQKESYLPRLAAGELLGAFALTEPSAGSDAASLKTTALKDGAEYVLNGEKCYISSAGWAGLYLVFARTAHEVPPNRGISAFLVDAATAGVQAGKPEQKMGAELSPIASLSFSNCRVPEDALLEHEGSGFKIALSGLAGGRVNIAAASVGISEAAVSRALKHLNERRQFGRSLMEFQGLQFMLADMKIKLEAARLLTGQAACFLKEAKSKSESILYSSMAKCFASDSAMSITTDAVQLLGGAGYLKEYQLERLMREAKMLQIVEGTNQIQRLLIAREM